jgi:glutamine synthetase
MMLNTIVAESIDFISDELEKFDSGEFNDNLQSVLQKIIRKHKRVVFNGDNYSDNWVREAEKRGLPNLRTTLDAIQPLKDPANHKLFTRYGVLSELEMVSRYEVYLEEYYRKIRIEGGIALEMSRNMITGAAADEFRRLGDALALAEKSRITGGCKALRSRMETLGAAIDALEEANYALDEALRAGKDEILPALSKVRKSADALEYLVDDRLWPLPKYREMLFVY